MSMAFITFDYRQWKITLSKNILLTERFLILIWRRNSFYIIKINIINVTYIFECYWFSDFKRQICFKLILFVKFPHYNLFIIVNFVLRTLKLFVVDLSLITKELFELFRIVLWCILNLNDHTMSVIKILSLTSSYLGSLLWKWK